MPGFAKIDHVVILMMENRSFDHYLGALNREGRADINGLGNVPVAAPGSEPLDHGVGPWCIDDINTDFFDPPHEWPEVRKQWNDGAMNRFVSTYFDFHKDKHPDSPVKLDEMSHVVMGFYTRRTLPVLYALADQFTVCDAWHSSFAGSTHPNRTFTFSGHCGDVLTTTWKNPFKNKPRPFWKAWENRISWGLYKWRPHDLSTFSIWSGDFKSNDRHVKTVKDFASHCKNGKLPNVCVVEPSYTSADDHPPHDPRRGQQFMGHVVDCLARSKSWANSLLIITYDEHGGFFDHVPPPKTPGNPAAPLDIQGFRVPTLIVSPYARPGYACHTPYEHTSILMSIAERWGLDVPDGMGARVGDATSIWADCFDFSRDPDQVQVKLPKLDADWTARLHPTRGTPIITDLIETMVHMDHVDSLNELKSDLGR